MISEQRFVGGMSPENNGGGVGWYLPGRDQPGPCAWVTGERAGFKGNGTRDVRGRGQRGRGF